MDNQENFEDNLLEDDSEVEWIEWERSRTLAVVQVICQVIHALHIKYGSYRRQVVTPSILEQRTREENRVQFRLTLMDHNKRFSGACHHLTRISPRALEGLCQIFRNKGVIKDSRRTSIEEKVIISLVILGYGHTIHTLSVFFCRSLKAINCCFHQVLRALILLEDEFLRQLDGTSVSSKIQNSTRFYPYFKDCIGALDGTHNRVKVSNEDAPKFRGRKDYPTQNVFVVCSFDLIFRYVLPGWEGTASDSRIIKNALTRENNLKISLGKYYLVDAGFMVRSGLIPPYRGVRYHLKEYSSRGPENATELFNVRHASLRNAIERAFGVLKKIFKIIESAREKTYSYEVQCEIVLACCILHNYLMGVDPDENLIAEVDRELEENMEPHFHFTENDSEDARIGATIRDNIAAHIWQDYVS